MTQDEIDHDWPLVLWHRTRVLALVQRRSMEAGARLRFNRGALIDRYSDTTTFDGWRRSSA